MNDRDLARGQLVSAVVGDEAEPTRRRMLAFLDEHEDALLRTCRVGHFTGSALVVDPASARMVVLLHRKVGRWLQPGGHADGEGDLAAVALREAQEETGLAGLEVRSPAIDLDIHEFRAPGEVPHLHLDVRYLVVARPGTRLAGNHESLAIEWVDRDGLVARAADPGLIRLADAGLARLGAGP